MAAIAVQVPSQPAFGAAKPAYKPTEASKDNVVNTSESSPAVALQRETAKPNSKSEGTLKLADWVKNQDNVPYWARIYPVEQPSFEEARKGHPEDRRAPHPDEEFPLSEAGSEERARRAKELDDLNKVNLTKRPLDEDFEPGYKYAWALPWFDERYKSKYFKDHHWEPFEHYDVGLRALTHKDPLAFLKKEGVTTDELSPGFGTKVRGIDLAALTADEKDQLALFVAQRGVVVFEQQEKFIDQTPEQLKDFGYHFSPKQHQHQVSGQPKDHPEFHLVYRSPKWPLDSARRSGRFSNKGWHSDISFEAQPASTTALFLFDSPKSGGDTLFVDQEETLRRLSPSFRAYLSTLKAEHDGFFQVELANKSKTGVARRPPVSNVHPVVRTHPVTGRESLYVSEAFTKRIVGLKDEESEAILALLKRLVNETLDAQVRIQWGPKDVVYWDNRRTSHSASYAKSDKQERRHGARITPQGERPFYVPRPDGFFVEQRDGQTEQKVEV